MASYYWFLHNLWLASYITLHMQPISIKFPCCLTVNMRPFHVMPHFQLSTYLFGPLFFDDPIFLIGLRGRNIIFVVSSLLPSTILSLRLPASSFLRLVYCSIYSYFHFSKCNQTWLLLLQLPQLYLVLTPILGFAINPSPTYLYHTWQKPLPC